MWICVEALDLALWFMLRIIVSSTSPSRGCCFKDAPGFFPCCWFCFFCRRVDKESETLLDLSLASSVATCSGHLHLSLPCLQAVSCDVCSCIMSASSLLWFIFRCMQLRIVIHLWQQPHTQSHSRHASYPDRTLVCLTRPPPDKGLPRFSLIRLSSVSLPLPPPGAVINSLGHILFADCVVVFYHASEIRMRNEGKGEGNKVYVARYKREICDQL